MTTLNIKRYVVCVADDKGDTFSSIMFAQVFYILNEEWVLFKNNGDIVGMFQMEHIKAIYEV